MTITVNGTPLERYLKIGQYSDVQQARSSEIFSKVQFHHIPARGIAQRYDVSPGPVIYKEVTKLNLEKDQQRLLEQIRTELSLDNPNKVKVITGILAGGEWCTVNDVSRKIQEISGDKVKSTPSAVAAFLSGLKNANGRAITQFLQRRKGMGRGAGLYRLPPPMAKLHLGELHQLTFKAGSFTLRDALIKVPELKDEVKKTPTTPDPPPPPGEAQDLSEVREVRVTVNVNFGPVRFLFGLDK